MLPRHRATTGRMTEKAVTGNRSLQTTPDFFPASRRTGGLRQKSKVEPVQGSDPVTNNANGSNWETVALWLFIAGIFIASVLAGYLFWAKLSFRSP
jgi:hypothetical protein